MLAFQQGYLLSNTRFWSTGADDCAPAPCQNGATCTDKVYSYLCQCPAGYSGLQCETGKGAKSRRNIWGVSNLESVMSMFETDFLKIMPLNTTSLRCNLVSLTPDLKLFMMSKTDIVDPSSNSLPFTFLSLAYVAVMSVTQVNHTD